MAAARPFILFFSGIFFSSVAFSPFILDYTLTPRLIVSALTLFALLLFAKKRSIQISANFILISYLLYVLFSWVSAFWAQTPSESIFENAKLSACFLVFVFSSFYCDIDEEKFIRSVCKVSVILFLIELAAALYQILHLPSLQKESLYTVYGINSHKNLFSSFILLQLPFIILCYKKSDRKWEFFSTIGITILYLGLLLLLQTKAVWIGCCISAFVFLSIVLYKRAKFTFNLKLSIIIFVVLANLFFIFLLPGIVQRGIDFNISQAKNETLQQKKELDQERLVLWDKTYSMFKKHPVLGVGAGNWQIYFPDATLKGLWRAEDLNYTFQRPHNDMLWILSETGLVGFNLVVIFMCSLWLCFVHVIKTTAISKQRYLELTLFAAIIPGFMTAAFFDFPKERIEHMVWLSLILGFCFHTVCKHLPNLNSKAFVFKPIHNYICVAACICIIVCGIYRYMGEYHTRKMYDHKALQNLAGVILEGKKALSFVYQIDPTSLPITWYTGNAYASQNAFELSQREFITALDKNPFNRNVLNDLGSSYASTSNNDLAIKYYKESARVSPRFDDPKLNMAAIYIRQKNYKAADSCLNTLFHDSERRSNYQKLVDAFLPDENQ
jgi:O-antigen ligase